jgi:hypothetical protein
MAAMSASSLTPRIKQAELGGWRFGLAQRLARCETRGGEQRQQLWSRPAFAEIVDHDRRVSGGHDDREHVAGCAAVRVVMDHNGEMAHGVFLPNSQPPVSHARMAPENCATMKPGASAGRMPAKLSVMARAMVMAGLAKEVEDVHQ